VDYPAGAGRAVSDTTALPPGFVPDQPVPTPATALPDGFTLDGHATSGPTDSPLTDIGRRIVSAGLNAATTFNSMIPHTGVAIEPGTGKISLDPYQSPEQRARQAAANKDYAYNATGATEYIPSTEAGKIAQAGLEAAPFSLFGGGILGNIASGAGAQAAGDAGVSPLVGALVGGKGANLAERGATAAMPGGMDAETRALAQSAVNNYGITPSLAQVSSNPFVRYLDSTVRKMPFSGYGGMDGANQSSFNQAVNSTFGETANKVTPQVLNSAYDRIGGVMNDVASRTNVQIDPQALTELANTHQMAGEVGLDQGQSGAVKAQIDKILDIASQNGGAIPGNVYQNLTKRGESLDVLQGNRSSTAGNLGGQIRDTLDDAFQRSASPDDAAALQQARTQYKALKTVEPLTMRADTAGGPTPSTGDISPAALNARVMQQYKNAPRAELGDIPLKDLGQIGQRFLKEPPESGTGPRSGIQSMIGHGGEVAGGLAAAITGHEMGVPLHYSLPSLAAAMVAPRMIGSALRNPNAVLSAVNGPQFSPLVPLLIGSGASSASAPATSANSQPRLP
jgi:hypothetical protein